MNDIFRYVIGHSPYDSSRDDHHTRSNGQWHTAAANMEEALQIIFGSMSFPAEPTGRNIFVPGVSLEGVEDDDVIQVWSSKPEVVAHLRKVVGERGGMHNGRGQNYGLEAEIRVTDIDKYCHSVRKLLGMPGEIEGEATTAVSPLGASVVKYHEIKHEIQKAAQVQKMELARRTWEVEALKEDMQGKMKVMQQQINVFDAYLHGTRHRTQLCRGKSGTGRYKVFQNRVFLSDEVAVLGNFVDMDFKGMEDLENWLMNSGHIWKLLPFERCILATSRLSTPMNKQIDEWVFHFNGKSVKFLVHMKRRRDPEAGETGPGALGLATFHAYFDRKYWTEQGMALEQLGFPVTPVSGHDYNEVFEKVKHTIWAAKEQAWDKVIAMAAKGIDRRSDSDKVKFSWGVGLRSKDGTLYKTADSRNYVTRRSCELLMGTTLFDPAEVKVVPYTEELEAALVKLDGMFVQFVGALQSVIDNPEKLLAATCKLLPLPLTEAEQKTKLEDEKHEREGTIRL